MSPNRGRRPTGNDTRAAIFSAAREQFTMRGYQGASLRSISRQAGVDPRMVGYFFGSKQELFVAVMETPTAIAEGFARGDDDLGFKVAQRILQIQSDPTAGEVFVGLIRSAANEPMAAKALHDRIHDRVLSLTGDVLEEPKALRASLMAAQVVGIFMARCIVGLEPLKSTPDARLARDLAPIFDHLISGSLEP